MPLSWTASLARRWLGLLFVLVCQSGALAHGSDDHVRPVTKVVRVLEDMGKQVAKDAEDDEDMYGKMQCWCREGEADKSNSIEVAQRSLETLATTIEESIEMSGSLTTEIGALKTEIQDDNDAVQEAEAVNSRESGEMQAFENDLVETATLLGDAIGVLSKAVVPAAEVPRDDRAPSSLLEVHRLVRQVAKKVSRPRGRRSAVFRSVMQQDLWDLVSALPLDGLAVQRNISELQQGQPPLRGGAAGAKSYSARSTNILGMLQSMKETSEKNLARSQREHLQAEIAFQTLRASKHGEVRVATASVEQKSGELATTQDTLAKSKTDAEATSATLEADQRLLADVLNQCNVSAAEFAQRKASRTNEAAAISKAISILLQDDARDSFSKVVSFMQESVSHRISRLGMKEAADQRRLKRASSALLRPRAGRRVAPRFGGWRLAALALDMRRGDGLDAARGAMKEMVANLRRQHEDENEKHKACLDDANEVEDKARATQSEVNELGRAVTKIKTMVKGLDKDLSELKAEMSRQHVSLQQAGEQRKAEGKEFRKLVSEQRSSAEVLSQALKVLDDLYSNSSLLEMRSVSAERQGKVEPGAALKPPPQQREYRASASGAGVLQMLEKVLAEVRRADAEAVEAEQASQTGYAELVANTNAALLAMQAEISEKTAMRATAKSDLADAASDSNAATDALKVLADRRSALHLSCDFLTKNFAARRQARQEEIEAVHEAMAILNGADFGPA